MATNGVRRLVAVAVRHWVWPTVSAVLAIAGFFVTSLPKAAVEVERNPAQPPQQAAALGSKTVVYELSAPDSGPATIAYLDKDGESVRTEVSLPWSVSLAVPSGGSPVGVTAQTNGSGLACRILLDGVERAKDAAARQHPAVNCTLMSV